MKHRAYVYDRGGKDRIGELTQKMLVRWDRDRDDISAATVTVDNPNSDCTDLLNKIEPGRHELVIFRNGKRVWEGPITLPTFDRYSVSIEAHDVWHYSYRTIMHRAYNNAYPHISSAVSRVTNILRQELVRKETLDPPINVLPHYRPYEIPGVARTSRSTKKYESTVWEEIDDMAAKGGIDYTAVGRATLVWDTHMPLSTTRVVTEKDFTNDITVSAYGMELATRTAVTDGLGRYGVAGGIDPYYGEWEVLNTAYQENEVDPTAQHIPQRDLDAQAKRNLVGRVPTPVVVRVPDNSSLTPAAVEELFDFLVPGVWVPLRASSTVRQVEQMQKIDSLRFEETEAGEAVTIVMSPAPGSSPLGDDAADQPEDE